MTTAPTNSMEALARGNAIRLARADAKRHIAAGDLDPAALLSEIPDWAQGWKVGDFVLACPEIGRGRMVAICRACQVSEYRTLGELTARQVGLLSTALSQPARSVRVTGGWR